MTALQFDSRKIVAAAGENGVKVRCDIPEFIVFISNDKLKSIDLQSDDKSDSNTINKRTYKTRRETQIYG